MATLYILRGISGSGKTTLAKEMASRLSCRHVEADMWFVRDGGEYAWDWRELLRAHNWCFDEAMKELTAGCSVIVSNTFPRLREFKTYIDFALDKAANVRIITCHGKYPNVHGLTEKAIAKQSRRFQSNLEIAQELKHDLNRYGRIVFSNHG